MTNMLEDLTDRCDVIEECYEFMLAYAAQGHSDDRTSQSGMQLRELLSRATEAASGLAGACADAVRELKLEPAEQYRDFLAVLDRDARATLAAMRLVMAQTRISAQLIDNLNASIHLRTLLTDIFLLDEILKLQRPSAS